MAGIVFTTHMRRSRCVMAVGDSLLRGMEEATTEPPTESAPPPHLKMGHTSLHSREH